ncbi:MAG: glycoside hydrolase family 65 [Oscillospiraceae bacterium]|nr:glycoside hydrolase family 65 [Oscillospiraceae bacterium]
MIDRKSLVKRHNPEIHEMMKQSPLTVGNGNFAFTADITGLQTLYDEYEIFPLCAMSTWGWHTTPGDGGKFYAQNDAQPTLYKSQGRVYKYVSERQAGNEAVYDWLRHNPHRLNLARVSLLWDGKKITSDEISRVHQKLDLYTGVLISEFTLRGERVRVQTVCAQSADILGISIETSQKAYEKITVCISFPYGSHLKCASDWTSPSKHQTSTTRLGDTLCFERTLDYDKYRVALSGYDMCRQTGDHSFEFKSTAFTLFFSQICTYDTLSANSTRRTNKSGADNFDLMPKTFDKVMDDSSLGWESFWNTVGMADFSRAKDPRAMLLERRVILSQYLTASQCSGNMPPQETGLSCNSWFGKFHLEMHIIHAGWFALWGQSRLLERSIAWYKDILDMAKKNAAANGFDGARWPKMTGPCGIDSPSSIATLLIWQQPHIIYMLSLCLHSKHRVQAEKSRRDFMIKHRDLVYETAEFMCSFARLCEKTGFYELPAPLIPVQELHKPEDTANPAFELGYWRFGLLCAVKWAEFFEADEESGLCGKEREKWQTAKAGWKNTADNMTPLPTRGGLYIAHQNCPDTFKKYSIKYNKDHPSMLYAFGYIPNDRVDIKTMENTADKVLSCWDNDSMWGWDYAFCAMTLTRLGKPEEAVDALLADESKNRYTESGNNFQYGRDDLPLYLPGNGALLFALSMMLAGYGENKGAVGFPKNGMWDNIIVEGILPLPE